MDYTEHKLLVKLSVLKKKAGETGPKSQKNFKKWNEIQVLCPGTWVTVSVKKEETRATLVIVAAKKERILTKELVIIDVNGDDD